MKKGIILTLAALWLSAGAFAQTPSDSLSMADDNSDETFTETQLDEDNSDATQAASAIMNAKNDPFMSAVGFRFSAMRFRVRGYDNNSSQTYMNGLLLNDMESGRFNYSSVGGLNDAVRNRESVSPFEFNIFGMANEGGAQNMLTRASQFSKGNKLTLSGTNRNYLLRGMYTFATGMQPNGWAFAGSVGYRWANEGVIEGTFYNSFSYFLAAEKRINDRHTLSLVTFGAPTERAQQAAATEEVYWLANSHYYNPNWGYQNGSKRNARVVHSFEPTAILTWDWRFDRDRKLTTSAGFKYNMYSSTALGWNGDAYDPRPDYYKNLPSSIFDVYDPQQNNPTYLGEHPFLLEQWNTLYDFWTSSKANRQINWDRMYFVNRQNEQLGGEALYYQERRHNNQLVFALSPTFSHYINTNNKYAIGAVLNHTKGMHYKTMADLLGGTNYTDVDKFAANDYGPNSTEAQNDLRHPNRQIRKDDKFGYDYNIIVNYAKLWGAYEHAFRNFGVTVGAHIDGTTIERDGKMQNGRAPENSYGKSGAAKFLAGGGKVLFAYQPIPNNTVKLGLSAITKAPLARNAFVAARMQNNFVDNLKVEDIFNANLSYDFRFGDFSGKISGYWTRMMNMVEQTAFYNDQEQRFTYLTMSNIDKAYYGVEMALRYAVTSKLSFNFIGSMGEAKYTNNPLAQVNYEGMNSATIASLNKAVNPVTGKAETLRVIADGMHANGTPLTALSLGANYNIKGWFFEADLNYYNRVYVSYSQYRRLSNVVPNYVSNITYEGNYVFEVTRSDISENGGMLYDADGNLLKAVSPAQEKFDGGFMLNTSIGRYIRLKRGKSISINLSFNNITNNRNLRTGGYEQNRDDFYSTGVARSYKFSRNSKYYYANAFNFFLNVGFRF